MSSASDPGIIWKRVTSSDATNYPTPYRAIMVCTTGDVSIVNNKGETHVLPSVPAYTTISLEVHRVNTTGTHASHFIIGIQ